jgi:hypothetical protein
MEILFNEQDLIDSACVFIADKYNEDIEHLEAELYYEAGSGISATTTLKNDHKTYKLTEEELIDALAVYLDLHHNFEPSDLTIELLFDEDIGISAKIEKNKRA